MTLVTGVDTIALTVSDLDRALGFYRDLLGMEVVETKGGGAGWNAEEQARWDAYHEKVCGIPGAQIKVAFLQAQDGSKLELIEYVKPKRPAGPKRPFSDPGVSIVPFALKDSVAVVKRLREAGVEVVADPQHYVLDGVESYTTYLYDADGNNLCFFEIVGG